MHTRCPTPRPSPSRTIATSPSLSRAIGTNAPCSIAPPRASIFAHHRDIPVAVARSDLRLTSSPRRTLAVALLAAARRPPPISAPSHTKIWFFQIAQLVVLLQI
ncbi:hypothetical protein U1Q18_031102 [Sarracenia purpurea var. burkii]